MGNVTSSLGPRNECEVRQGKLWTCDHKTRSHPDPAALVLDQYVWFTWAPDPLPEEKGIVREQLGLSDYSMKDIKERSIDLVIVAQWLSVKL